MLAKFFNISKVVCQISICNGKNEHKYPLRWQKARLFGIFCMLAGHYRPSKYMGTVYVSKLGIRVGYSIFQRSIPCIKNGTSTTLTLEKLTKYVN